MSQSLHRNVLLSNTVLAEGSTRRTWKNRYHVAILLPRKENRQTWSRLTVNPGHNLHSLCLHMPGASKTYLLSLIRAMSPSFSIPEQDCSPSLPHIPSPTRNPICKHQFPHAADHFRSTTSQVAHRTWHHMQRPSDIPKLLTEQISTALCTLTNPNLPCKPPHISNAM